MLSFLWAAAVAATVITAPSNPPAMQALALSSAPVVDGKVLDDQAWSGAVPARNFWQV
jgi:hypothetical protein